MRPHFLAAVAGLACAGPAHAYWEFGHQTIAAIARANIRPATRRAVDRLLARQDLLATPTCPARSMEQASVWADCIKPLKDAAGKDGAGKPRFGYAYGWHFQDVNICRPFDLTAACKDGNCVSAQIERDVRLLRDRHAPTRTRVEALAFLIHFVGDLHQPLHAGEKDDKGGNDVKASYGGYAPPRLNLHSIWDGYLAERAITTGPSLVRHYPAAVRARVAAGTVTDWSRESWRVSRDVTYANALGGDPCAPTGTGPAARVALDEATIERLIAPARLEVERGGLRLARLLDAALGQARMVPDRGKPYRST